MTSENRPADPQTASAVLCLDHPPLRPWCCEVSDQLHGGVAMDVLYWRLESGLWFGFGVAIARACLLESSSSYAMLESMACITSLFSKSDLL